MLTWKAKEKWFVTSECGRYNISFAKVMGKVVYSAWRNKRDKNGMAVPLGVAATSEAARKLCEDDLNG